MKVILAIVVGSLAMGGGVANAQEPVPESLVVLSVGSNTQGQLGRVASSPSLVPAASVLPPVTAAVSGRDHGYAIDSQATVWGWGDNGLAQVGNGGGVDVPTPVSLGLTEVVDLASGHYHGLAVKRDGTLWTWGYGGLGQLGHGVNQNETRPRQVQELSGVRTAFAGRDASFAINSDGGVVSWGGNSFGELGDGTTLARNRPGSPIAGLPKVVDLAGGRNHVLAVGEGGSLWAWGDNTYGQLGDGTVTRRTTPIRINLPAVKEVSAGAHHSVALLETGQVYVWGRGYRGQLGLGANDSPRLTPTQVPGLPAIAAIGTGRDSTYAVGTAGAVLAWGANEGGQVGDGTTERRYVPVALPLQNVRDVEGGSSHALFLVGEPDPPPNVDPVAVFTQSCAGLRCSFDGSGSNDPDGDGVTAYAWDFPGGVSSTVANPSYEFAAAGDYPVSLTVTDGRGATGSVTRTVTVSEAVGSKVAFRARATYSGNVNTARVRVPSSVQPSDGLLLFVSNASGLTPASVSSGWSLVGQRSLGNLRSQLYVRTATATSAGSEVVVTLPAGSLAKQDLTMLAYSGTAVSPVGQWAAVTETSLRAAHVAPALPVGTTSSWVMSYWVDRTSSGAGTWTAPADAVTRSTLAGTGGGKLSSLAVDFGAAVPQGTWPAKTAMAALASSTAVMWTIELRSS